MALLRRLCLVGPLFFASIPRQRLIQTKSFLSRSLLCSRQFSSKKRFAEGGKKIEFKSCGKVAIIGRPNVGKSTLFNRLMGRSLAIVDPTPGVTRDRKIGEARLGGLEFELIDTPGLEELTTQELKQSDFLQEMMMEQTRKAVEEADVVLFVFDARQGVTSMDQHFGRWLRRVLGSAKGATTTRPRAIVPVANKCEGNVGLADALEVVSLGFGSPLMISAEHKEGFDELYSVLVDLLPGPQSIVPSFAPQIDEQASFQKEINPEVERAENEVEDTGNEENKPSDDAPPLQLAIVGRPNVGKSTLINAVVGENRVLVSSLAGTTRDSIRVPLHHAASGKDVVLIDTAGLVGTSGTTRNRLNRLDGLVHEDTLRAINFANICALVVDIDKGQLEKSDEIQALERYRFDHTSAQSERDNLCERAARIVFPKADIAIASKIIEEGRALLILVNKWDQLSSNPLLQRNLLHGLSLLTYRVLPRAKGVPILPLSALHRENLDGIMPAVLKQYDRWQRRCSTFKLNAWLREITRFQPPPRIQDRPTRIKFMVQTHIRPPRFTLFFNRAPKLLPDSYLYFLINKLREELDLAGIPIRMAVKASAANNPFATHPTHQPTKFIKK